MPSIETYRKLAKQLLRWHRERNYSVGGKVRLLERFRHLTDIEILDMPLPLASAQEIVAAEAGFKNWAELKAGCDGTPGTPLVNGRVVLRRAVPVLFVRDVTAAAEFYRGKLGFEVDFLHGNPPFYGSVSRDGACLHLRFVHLPNFSALAATEDALILAIIEVANVKALSEELESRGVELCQRLTRQPWGGLDFHVRDPDGNVVAFVQYRLLAS